MEQFDKNVFYVESIYKSICIWIDTKSSMSKSSACLGFVLRWWRVVTSVSVSPALGERGSSQGEAPAPGADVTSERLTGLGWRLWSVSQMPGTPEQTRAHRQGPPWAAYRGRHRSSGNVMIWWPVTSWSVMKLASMRLWWIPGDTRLPVMTRDMWRVTALRASDGGQGPTDEAAEAAHTQSPVKE